MTTDFTGPNADELAATLAEERSRGVAFFAVERGPFRALVSKVPRILPARVVLVDGVALVVSVPERRGA